MLSSSALTTSRRGMQVPELRLCGRAIQDAFRSAARLRLRAEGAYAVPSLSLR
jgi:hypothetical protein